MSGHWGIPGPGGSMGQCAVCGEDFAAGVIMDLCGQDSGIESFSVGFIEQTLYCHIKDCKQALRDAFAAGDGIADTDEKNCAVRDALPEGPLREALTKAIDKLEAGSSA